MKELWGLRLLLIMLSFALPHYAFAKDNKDLLQSLSKKEGGANTLFIENKGQIGDQYGKPNSSVKYLILRPGLNIQLKANSFSYDAYTVERFKRIEQLVDPLLSKFDKHNDDSLVYHFSRVDIELVDANPNPEITQEGASSDYLNYYTHITSQTHGEEGVTGIKGYSTITYHDIFPNIDLEWFLDKDGKPEYQFIINPGGEPSRIRLKYHGAQKTELISDAIHFHIKPGIIKEHIPVSYLKESKEKLQIAFTRTAIDEYGFKIPTYASNETLIIDPMPTIFWSKLLGGVEYDVVTTSTIDSRDNIYICGISQSTIGIATSGSFSSAYQGATDGFFSKYTFMGELEYSTYIGGSSWDECYGIATVDQMVVIGGHTTSENGIATSNGFLPSIKGHNSFIQRFTLSGLRVWGTYLGGDAQDWLWTLKTDASGNIICGGSTFSKSGLFTIPDKNFDQGPGFLTKISNSCKLLWSIPTPGITRGISAYKNDIYVIGNTQDTSGITTANCSQPNHGGGIDCYLTKFNIDGKLQWSTYFGGENNEETINGLIVDEAGFVYITGSTSSLKNISTKNSHNTTFQGPLDDKSSFGDSFLCKFDFQGNKLWSTYIGGSRYDYRGPICFTPHQNIQISLTTDSDSIFKCTPQNEKLGSYDIFVAEFKNNGDYVSSFYYGGLDYEEITGAFYNSKGDLIVTGITTSSLDFPVDTNTNYAKTKGAGFVTNLKIYNPKLSGISLRDTVLCSEKISTLSVMYSEPFFSDNKFYIELTDSLNVFNLEVVQSSIDTNKANLLFKVPNNLQEGVFNLRVICSSPPDTLILNKKVSLIKLYPKIILFGDNNYFCEGDSRGLTCSIVADSYIWKRNNIEIADAIEKTYIAFVPGLYSVVTVFRSCLAESPQQEIIKYDAPSSNISGDSIIFLNSQSKYQTEYRDNHRYNWTTSNNIQIQGLDTNNFVYVKATSGEKGYVQVKVTSEIGCIAIDSITPVIAGLSSVSDTLSFLYEEKEYKVVRNPVAKGNYFNIEFFKIPTSPVILDIFDLFGRTIKSIHHSGTEDHVISFDLHIPGFYLLRLYNNGRTYFDKLIVD
jgi:hypothetical protein